MRYLILIGLILFSGQVMAASLYINQSYTNDVYNYWNLASGVDYSACEPILINASDGNKTNVTYKIFGGGATSGTTGSKCWIDIYNGTQTALGTFQAHSAENLTCTDFYTTGTPQNWTFPNFNLTAGGYYWFCAKWNIVAGTAYQRVQMSYQSPSDYYWASELRYFSTSGTIYSQYSDNKFEFYVTNISASPPPPVVNQTYFNIWNLNFKSERFNSTTNYSDLGCFGFNNGSFCFGYGLIQSAMPITINNTVVIQKNLIIDGNLSVKRPYAMFSSTQNQTVAVANTAYNVSFNNTEEAYAINKTNNVNFTFAQKGAYLFEVSAILAVDLPNKHMELWVRKNNVDIPRSNTKLELPSASTEMVLAVPFIISVNTSDVITFMYASDDAGSMLLDTPATAYSPESPSIIVTITKLSDQVTS